MELIAKEKSRLVAFKKSKEGLIRKIHEFTTLCDVSACMIIYGPKQEPGSEVSVRLGGAVAANDGVERLLLLMRLMPPEIWCLDLRERMPSCWI